MPAYLGKAKNGVRPANNWQVFAWRVILALWSWPIAEGERSWLFAHWHSECGVAVMQSMLLRANVACALWVMSAGTVFAQAERSPAFEESPRTWVDAIDALGTSKLTILLIFGTGFVAAAGYAVAGVVRAFNGSPDESEELGKRIDELEDRVEKIEAKATG